MNKREFLAELRGELAKLPKDDDEVCSGENQSPKDDTFMGDRSPDRRFADLGVAAAGGDCDCAGGIYRDRVGGTCTVCSRSAIGGRRRRWIDRRGGICSFGGPRRRSFFPWHGICMLRDCRIAVLWSESDCKAASTFKREDAGRDQEMFCSKGERTVKKTKKIVIIAAVAMTV